MSYAVLRGSPKQSQLYLDDVLDSIIKDSRTKAKSREEVNLAEILYYILKTNPGATHSINAATDSRFTNEQIQKRAVSLARALRSLYAADTVILMLRNHEHMSALYYGVLFAGVVPFMMEPASTEFELQQFLPLVCPRLIFCEPDRVNDVTKAVQGSDVTVVSGDGPSLDQFVRGFSEDIDTFQLPEVQPASTAYILPTSGSTGVPKAAMLNHQGIVMQLPCTWLYHTQFPHPTRLGLLLSTGQWMTHNIIMTTFPVYQVPILMTPLKITAEYLANLAGKYNPTWTIMGPSLAATLGAVATRKQLESFENFYVAGSPFSPETLAPLKDKLSTPTGLLNAFGMTELHGFVAMGPSNTPLTSVGKFINTLDYKIVNESGEEVTRPYEKGEVYLKGKSLFKGYVKNEAAYRETLSSDGWLKTGDIFYRNEEDFFFFVNRTKLSFKYLNHHIYPEELEVVIGSVPGVQQCVAVGTDAGPAAAIVQQPGSAVAREIIHEAVNSTLSDYKRLRGGIAFVPSLPRTHNGKIHRARCLEIINELIKKKECF